MIEVKRAELAARLPWRALSDAIAQKVAADDVDSPPRMSFDIEGGSQNGGGTLLVMPAWRGREVIGLKTVTFWPDNRDRGEASHAANYILMDARSGAILAILDGEELTRRRTAAVSVLAARHLLRKDARSLVVIGTGPIAENLVRAHRASGRFSSIALYGRDHRRAIKIAAELTADGASCEPIENIEAAVRSADMIVTATSATTALFDGEWVREGAHIDLVGSFHPAMRETDDRLFARAGSIWVDTLAAVAESGDLTQPIEAGVIRREDIAGDLRRLVSVGGRQSPSEITIFKAVGYSLPDLAAAEFALSNSSSKPSAAAV